jgi:hypothetical protein
MKKITLSPKGRQWLKSIHLIVSVVWVGAAISMNMLRVAWTPVAGTDLYAVDHAISLIDNWVVVPAAMLSLLTGLLESWLTSWGFFKFRWVTVKWIATLAMMISAPFFISRWDREIAAMSKAEGLLALQNPVYLQERMLYTVVGVGFIITLILLSVISTLKPWIKNDRAGIHRKQAAAVEIE